MEARRRRGSLRNALVSQGRPTQLTPAPTARATARVRNSFARTVQFVSRNRTLVLFVLFLVLGDIGFGLLAPVWDRHSPDDYVIRVRGCAARPRDVVFVGGSPVSEAIDPAVLAGAMWHGRPLADAYAIGLPGGTTTD